MDPGLLTCTAYPNYKSVLDLWYNHACNYKMLSLDSNIALFLITCLYTLALYIILMHIRYI